eukprot:1752698-Rhodomonas_salina.2
MCAQGRPLGDERCLERTAGSRVQGFRFGVEEEMKGHLSGEVGGLSIEKLARLEHLAPAHHHGTVEREQEIRKTDLASQLRGLQPVVGGRFQRVAKTFAQVGVRADPRAAPGIGTVRRLPAPPRVSVAKPRALVHRSRLTS